MAHQKAYGLIIPKSSKGKVSKIGKSAAIFQNDSSEEDESKKKSLINQELNAVAEKKKQTKQTKEDIERALREDPNVYKYDEIYEEMEQKKQTVGSEAKEKDKKPKYIANLLKSAAMRKKEQERRIERSVQREREKEGDQFADKESFVTAAYRQKMIEQAEEEEKSRRQDEFDAANDVTKQKDLSKFYRNLLDGNVSMGAPVEEQEHSRLKETKTEKKSKESGEEKDAEYSSPESQSDGVDKYSRDKSSNKKGKQYHSRERNPSEKAWEKRNTYHSSDSSCEEATGDRQPVVSGKANERRKGERRYRKGRARDERSSSSESDSDHVEKSKREPGTNKISNDGKYSMSKSSNHRYLREGSGSKDSTGRLDRDATHSRHGRERSQVHVEKYQREKRSRERSRESRRKRSSEKDKKERSVEGNKRRHASSGSSPEISRKKDKGGGSVERKNQSDRQYLEQKSERKNNGKETIDKERSKVFAKRNDADSVLGARERYLARKQGRIVPITHDDDDSD